MNSQTLSTVPHLLTANAHPIEEIERHILARQDQIELWFRHQFHRSPGMSFQPLAFAEACNTPDPGLAEDASPNRFYAYGVIGRLALLAATREIEESKQI